METFVILSHQDLFREGSTWEAVEELLRGVALEALVRYAANFCHRLTYGDEVGAEVERFQEFQRWFLEHFVPDSLRSTVFGLLEHRRAYRNRVWVFSDPHRVANLVAAYLRANCEPPPGTPSDEGRERLARAQFMVNDLVSVSRSDTVEELPAAQVLQMFAMAQRPSFRSDLARSFELFAERLPRKIPNLEPAVRSRCGVGFSEILVFLFTAYNLFLSALDPGDDNVLGVPKPPWTRGIIDLSGLSPGHPGERLMRRVYDLYSADWATLRGKIMESPQGDAGIRPFLRWPFLRLDHHRLWCFDPGLILTAATNGLLWLGVETLGNGVTLLTTLGGIFEDYIDDLFRNHGAGHVRRGDEEGEGLPDFFWLEGGTLVVIEAKASVMRDEVKWAADAHATKEQFGKILKENQLPKATQKLLSRERGKGNRVARVVPVFVVLDPCFTSPGLEPLLNDALDFTPIACSVECAHLLRISELENAIPFVRDCTFARLLAARREAGGPSASVSADELLTSQRHSPTVRRHVGRIPEPLDVLGRPRERLNGKMREIAEALDPACGEGPRPGGG